MSNRPTAHTSLSPSTPSRGRTARAAAATAATAAAALAAACLPEQTVLFSEHRCSRRQQQQLRPLQRRRCWRSENAAACGGISRFGGRSFIAVDETVRCTVSLSSFYRVVLSVQVSERKSRLVAAAASLRSPIDASSAASTEFVYPIVFDGALPSIVSLSSACP
jgi:hypothetical protein